MAEMLSVMGSITEVRQVKPITKSLPFFLSSCLHTSSTYLTTVCHSALCCLQLNLSYNDIGAEGAKPLADALRVSGSVTCCNVLKNDLNVAAAQLLVEAVKDKDVSLAGIKCDQKSADFNGDFNQRLKPADAVLLASDLSKAGVSGSITSVRHTF